MQVRMRTTPVSTKEAIRTVMRNGHVKDRDSSKLPLNLRDGRHIIPIDFRNLWEVVRKPKSTDRSIKGQDHHSLASNTTELLEPAREIRPVVDGENRKRRIKALIP